MNQSDQTHSNVNNLLKLIEQYKNEERIKIEQIKKQIQFNSKDYRIKQRSLKHLEQKKYQQQPVRPQGFITTNKIQQYFDPEIERKFIHINKQQLPDYQRLSILSPERAKKSFRLMHPPTHELKTSRIINRGSLLLDKQGNQNVRNPQYSSMNEILQDY